VTDLRIVDTDPTELAVDAIVIGIYRSDGSGVQSLRLAPGARQLAAAFEDKPGGGLLAILHRLGATGAADEVTKVATFGALPAPLLVATGLGTYPADGVTPAETLRRAAGAATRALAGAGSVALVLPEGESSANDPSSIRPVAEGALLGNYRFDRYHTRQEPSRREPVASIVLPIAGEIDGEREVARTLAVTAAVARARDWVNTAPNDLRPGEFAEEVARTGRAAGLGVDVLDETDLEREGFGGILAVGKGSAAAPRLVRMTYRPQTARTSVALVGKGITFDSGGLSIKPGQNMWEMKSDMAGAAAVASAMLAIATLQPEIAVTAYLPMAENMPSGSAYRPGDVVSMRNGKLVEILNTDAEGRLLLADAIAWACEDRPEFLLETSTLTGGQVVALGKRIAGIMGTPELLDRVKAAGDQVGSRCGRCRCRTTSARRWTPTSPT
jgi:leucyl aminopeptidase